MELLQGTSLDELRSRHQTVTVLKDTATVEQALKVSAAATCRLPGVRAS